TVQPMDERSESVLVRLPAEDGQEDDLDVPEEAPVADVLEVVLDALLHLVHGVRLAAPAVHLSPAGDARFDLVTEHVAVNLRAIELVMGDGVRPRRSEER